MNAPAKHASNRTVVGAGLGLLAITVLHSLDHMRQGRSLSGAVVSVGIVGVIALIVSIVLAVRKDPHAPEVAILVGFGTVVGLVAVHVVPHWSIFSDPYPAAHVDGLAWASLIAFMVAGAALGIAGLVARREPGRGHA